MSKMCILSSGSRLLMASFLVIATAMPATAARKLVEEVESRYNSIFIYRDGDYVSMTFGYNRRLYTESIMNQDDELELPVKYTRHMVAGLAYAPRARKILMIGMGGGRTSWYIHKIMPDAELTVVELDPDVVRLAEKHFKVREEDNYAIVTRDGRSHLMREDEKYDLIMVDAYRGPFVPFHLLTTEFYELIVSRLMPGGIVIQNVEPNTMLFDSAAATMQTVFKNVDYFDAGGNIVSVAYDFERPDLETLKVQADEQLSQYSFRYDFDDTLDQRRLYAPAESVKPLTDDFAPVNALRAIEVHNRRWD